MMDGYTYTGDTSSYLVTMLKRDTKRKTAHIRVDRLLSGAGSLPEGVTFTVPLRRVTVNRKPVK